MKKTATRRFLIKIPLPVTGVVETRMNASKPEPGHSRESRIETRQVQTYSCDSIRVLTTPVQVSFDSKFCTFFPLENFVTCFKNGFHRLTSILYLVPACSRLATKLVSIWHISWQNHHRDVLGLFLEYIVRSDQRGYMEKFRSWLIQLDYVIPQPMGLNYWNMRITGTITWSRGSDEIQVCGKLCNKVPFWRKKT